MHSYLVRLDNIIAPICDKVPKAHELSQLKKITTLLWNLGWRLRKTEKKNIFNFTNLNQMEFPLLSVDFSFRGCWVEFFVFFLK